MKYFLSSVSYIKKKFFYRNISVNLQNSRSFYNNDVHKDHLKVAYVHL